MTEKKFNIITAREITGGIKFGQIKTRGGKPARIICWNAKGDRPVVALIDMGTSEMPLCFTNEGRHDVRPNVSTNYDLIIETEGGEV